MTGKRSRISCITGTLRTMDVAEVAAAGNCSKNKPNWTGIERSSPSSALMRSTASSVARMPSNALVGSPGSRRTRTKMTTMTRKKVGTICANLTIT